MLIPNTDETLNDNLYVLFAHSNVEKLTKLGAGKAEKVAMTLQPSPHIVDTKIVELLEMFLEPLPFSFTMLLGRPIIALMRFICMG